MCRCQKGQSAVSSFGDVDPLEEKFASWWSAGSASPVHEWLEDWNRARCDAISVGSSSHGQTAGVRLLAGHVGGTFLRV